jgi:16S rRNA (cytidine1402-2'-O)-methyltransferase
MKKREKTSTDAGDERVPPEGCLLVCATPIGNLEDITFRALRFLKEADLVAAENMGHSRKLLSHYGIKTRLVSYREENRDSQGEYLLTLMGEGKKIALISDAGMPGLSDPGTLLIRRCHDRKIPVICAPGASSVLMAIVLSGFSTSRFVFEGFLPGRRPKRTALLSALAHDERTAIIFTGPHHLKGLLQVMAPHTGERQIVVLRELTKLHEEVRRGTASELLCYYGTEPVRGEITLVVEGAADAGEERTECPCTNLRTLLESYMEKGYRLRDAAKEVACRTGVPARQVYECGVELKKRTTNEDGEN